MTNGAIDHGRAILELQRELGELGADIERVRAEIGKERHRFNNFEQGWLGEFGRIPRLDKRVETLDARIAALEQAKSRALGRWETWAAIGAAIMLIAASLLQSGAIHMPWAK